MQINRIQNYNYNPYFQGILKIQNLQHGVKVNKIKTTHELDRGLAQTALKNLFDGNWENEGIKNISKRKLFPYIEALKQTLGISLPQSGKELEKLELKHFDNGYSIKSENNYKITHIREDQMIWD